MDLILRNGQVALVDAEDFERVYGLPWTVDAGGYVHAWVGEERLLLHRVILGAEADQFLDHRFHDKLNNRKRNLRFATKQQNARNRHKIKRPTSSRFKGVCWFKRTGQWQCRITISRVKRQCLGYFSREEDAALAYNRAAKLHFGEFALLNEV